MKKYLFIVLCIFSLFAFSCGEKKVENQEPVSEEVEVESEEEVIVPAREVTFQDVQKATSPIYEEISSFDGPVYKRLKSKKRNYSSDKKSESVIPGVRNLSEYKAAYSEIRKELEYSVIDEVDDNNKKVSALTITEWGPKQNYNPQNGSSIYFVFSKPMRSLGGSDEILVDSDIFTITPPLKGHYRWFGANQINYEAEESVKPDTNYVIKFNKNIKALDGSTFEIGRAHV